MVGSLLYVCNRDISNYRYVLIASVAKLSGKDLSYMDDFKYGVTNATSEFLSRFPFGKVPALYEDDGYCLSQSYAIAMYLASDALKGGSSARDIACVNQYLFFAACDLNKYVCALAYPVRGMIKYVEETAVPLLAGCKITLKKLNATLEDKTFFVRESLTLADLALFTELVPLLGVVIEKKDHKMYPYLLRWFNTILNSPELVSLTTGFKFCDKYVPFNEKAYNERYGVKSAGKKAEKKQQPKTEPKKQEPVQKKKMLFSDLPPSSFVMDEWKRMYCNNDISKVAMPWLWENFDAEGYSLWYSEYKYGNELTKIYMAKNFIRNMLHNATPMSRFLFGNVVLLGTDNNLQIRAVWLCRGKGNIFLEDEETCFDHDLFNFRKIDHASETDRKLAETYFDLGESIEDIPVAGNNVFK